MKDQYLELRSVLNCLQRRDKSDVCPRRISGMLTPEVVKPSGCGCDGTKLVKQGFYEPKRQK